MQDPNEDTEWNDLLRKKGILPPKPKEVNEDEVIQLLEETVKERTKEGKHLDEMELDELDELEDEEEERVLQQYRLAFCGGSLILCKRHLTERSASDVEMSVEVPLKYGHLFALDNKIRVPNFGWFQIPDTSIFSLLFQQTLSYNSTTYGLVCVQLVDKLWFSIS